VESKLIDVLVIGGGGAGLISAITAKERGLSVLLATKKAPTYSQTVMAQGGINAPLGNLEADSVELHIKDTLKASNKIADPKMVEKLISNSIETIKYLEKIGVPFSRIDDAKSPIGSIAQRKLGGASKKRACYAQDYTGLKTLHTLYDRALKLGLEIKEGFFLLELIIEESKVFGGVFWDFESGEVVTIQAKNVILATGGFGGIYQNHTTNTNSSTGDGVAVAMRAGARVSNMEFLQFHPTALKGSSVLISESARGEGGYLINSLGKRFVDELAPRDVVVKAIFKEFEAGRDVFLDIRHLGEEKLNSLMPQELHLCRVYANIDPLKEPIPISPALHYTIGGVDVDSRLKVIGLENCFCVGEVSCSHIHGANRLGGNSLLEIFAFGKMIAEQIKSEDKLKIDTSKIKQHHQNIIDNLFNREPNFNPYSLKKELGSVMFEHFGILRDKNRMLEGISKIEEIQNSIQFISPKDKSKEFNQELLEILELKNAILVSKAVAKSAIWREESRGVHLRSDFPETLQSFECSSVYFDEDVKSRDNEK